MLSLSSVLVLREKKSQNDNLRQQLCANNSNSETIKHSQSPIEELLTFTCLQIYMCIQLFKPPLLVPKNRKTIA